MNCQRCKSNEARYRVFTDILNLEVCTSCVIKALELGIAIEDLPRLRTDDRPGDTNKSLDPLLYLN
jgi:hypothetical protein